MNTGDSNIITLPKDIKMGASKRERNKKKIMHVAKGLFEKHGLENVTFNQIAEDADVCRTTVFNYFANINELMLAIYEQEIEDLIIYCRESGKTGYPLIYALFEKLIEDTSFYPVLTYKLTTNATINNYRSAELSQVNTIKSIELIVLENLQVEKQQSKSPITQHQDGNLEDLTMLVMGAYYAPISNYYTNDKAFEHKIIKQQMKKLLEYLLK